MTAKELICKTTQCQKPVRYSTGLCSGHQTRFRKGQDTTTPLASRGSHGQSQSDSRTYTTWESMRTRCFSVNAKEYPMYGGAGRTVCKRWSGSDGFANFLEDMGERPEDTTLDRIDNNGGYAPENCRWADKCVQQQNQGPSKRNKTGQRGVSWTKRLNKYTVQICARNKKIFLGNFKDFDEAIEVRKEAEIKYWSVS